MGDRSGPVWVNHKRPGLAPLVFLDFDGVIMTAAWDSQYRKPDPRAIGNLNRLVYATGAFVVISSTWRGIGLGRCRALLKAAGFEGKPIGITPSFAGRSEEYCRGDEIGSWLTRRAQGHRPFVILDDDADMGEFGDRLVQTASRVGLTATDVERAVVLLGG